MSRRRSIFGRKRYPKVSDQITARELIQREATVGASLFGHLGPNRTRQFFMLDKHTWIWYEEWKDARGLHRVTTRYEIHRDHVLKIQNDEHPVMVDGEELNNLYTAANAYYRAVANQVYNRPVGA